MKFNDGVQTRAPRGRQRDEFRSSRSINIHKSDLKLFARESNESENRARRRRSLGNLKAIDT